MKVAVTSGLKGAAILLNEIKRGESPYHFIEVMGCPGGCISGGGQPRPVNDEIRLKRMQAIYREDEGKALRENLTKIKTFRNCIRILGEPLGHLSHEFLHTTYTKRNNDLILIELFRIHHNIFPGSKEFAHLIH